MNSPNENNKNSVNWEKIYDYYEVQHRNSYRQIAKYQNESHFELIKYFLKKKILKNDNFCEIGFGAGITLRYASGFFKKVIGIDISPKNVELTSNELKKEGYKNIELHVSDIMKKNNFFKEKFDVISFIHGIEHFSEKDITILLNNIKYYLKPGGSFTGALPYDKDFTYRMCPNCGHVFEIDGHLSRYNTESLSKLFKKHKYKIQYVNDFNFYYYLRRKGIIKLIYRFITRFILRKKTALGQLEFVVKSI